MFALHFPRFESWAEQVQRELRRDSTKKVVILEVGAGDRVPTIRMNSETLLQQFSSNSHDAGCTSGSGKVGDTGIDTSQACLIRVNPELPFASRKNQGQCVSIQSTGLRCLQMMDREMARIWLHQRGASALNLGE